jgi:hypothetical protein
MQHDYRYIQCNMDSNRGCVYNTFMEIIHIITSVMYDNRIVLSRRIEDGLILQSQVDTTCLFHLLQRTKPLHSATEYSVVLCIVWFSQ